VLLTLHRSGALLGEAPDSWQSAAAPADQDDGTNSSPRL